MVQYKFNPDLPFIKENWPGNPFIDGRFYNNAVQEPQLFWELWRWVLSANPQRKEKKAESYSVPIVKTIPDFLGADKLIWLGHSTFFIRLGGMNFITDPCFFHIFPYKRHADLPFDPNLLKNIDYLLLSHDHRDHLQTKSIALLVKNNPRMQALVPLNATRLLTTRSLRTLLIQEAGWYQQYKTSPDIDVIYLPAKHWCKRSILDYNKTLWGSFLIKANGKTLYFGADTAKSNVFKDIFDTVGSMDTCLLPISAYAPDYVMARSHATPEEAVDIFKMLKGKQFIPTHYGAYDLSDEPMGEPIRRLKTCIREQNLDDALRVPAIGETVLL